MNTENNSKKSIPNQSENINSQSNKTEISNDKLNERLKELDYMIEVFEDRFIQAEKDGIENLAEVFKYHILMLRAEMRKIKSQIKY